MIKPALLHSILLVTAGMLLPSFAYAHIGAGEAGGFMQGFTHPASGLDHV